MLGSQVDNEHMSTAFTSRAHAKVRERATGHSLKLPLMQGGLGSSLMSIESHNKPQHVFCQPFEMAKRADPKCQNPQSHTCRPFVGSLFERHKRTTKKSKEHDAKRVTEEVLVG
eukprot:5317172-Amphidinium_carterae.1